MVHASEKGKCSTTYSNYLTGDMSTTTTVLKDSALCVNLPSISETTNI